MQITTYNLHRLHVPLARPIGDSQVRFTHHWITVLELTTDSGLTGVGFELQQGIPTTGLEQLKAQFEFCSWPALERIDPVTLPLRITRPRGGNVGAAVLPLAVQTALWDLLGKGLELPLYRLLGGVDPRVRAYGSTLDFHLSDVEFRERLEEIREMGFQAVKIKVGHPDVEWDLRRIAIATEVMGQENNLMVDANEAWSPKETLRRAGIYRDTGFEIYWIEDPITREDYEGYRRLVDEIPDMRINTGEYLGFSGKRQLLEHRAVDVLNIHGDFAASRAAAQLAGDYGVPVSLGNTILEIGVHLAASLPECLYLEFSDLTWNQLAAEPVRFEDGYALAPDRPGHGIELKRDALERFSRPE